MPVASDCNAGPSRYHEPPMRMTTAAIRGSRPTTRFTFPTGLRRKREFGLRRTSPLIRPATPGIVAQQSPVAALHRAVRGLGRPIGSRPAGVLREARRALSRADAMCWSDNTAGTAHHARPRSAAPWRG
jgi:hypothetical protein